MLTIRELSDLLNNSVCIEEQLAALKVQYKKSVRVLHCILKDSDGVISNEDWFTINNTNDGMDYSYSIICADKVVVTSHVNQGEKTGVNN